MPFCKKCGTRLEPDNKFCLECGEAVTTPLKPTKRVSEPKSFGRMGTGLNRKLKVLLVIAIALVAVVAGGYYYVSTSQVASCAMQS